MQHHSWCQTYQPSSNHKPRDLVWETFNCVDCLWGFVDFFCSDIFSLCQYSQLHFTPFSLHVDCSLVHIIILDHVRGVSFEFGKFLAQICCVLSIPSVFFTGLILKTFLCCYNRAKRPPGKCELHRNIKFYE